MLSKATQYVRNLAQSPALSPFLGVESSPGPATQSEADWQAYVRSKVSTECVNIPAFYCFSVHAF